MQSDFNCDFLQSDLDCANSVQSDLACQFRAVNLCNIRQINMGNNLYNKPLAKK